MEIKQNEAIAKVEANDWNLAICSIHPDLQKMLVEQMAHELYNHNLYSIYVMRSDSILPKKGEIIN